MFYAFGTISIGDLLDPNPVLSIRSNMSKQLSQVQSRGKTDETCGLSSVVPDRTLCDRRTEFNAPGHL